MRTSQQLAADLRDILDCNHGDLVVRERVGIPVEPGHTELEIRVRHAALNNSMFDQDQFDHIVASLTPSAADYKLKVLVEEVL